MFQKEKEVTHQKRKRGPILMMIGIGLLAGVIGNEVKDYHNEKALLATVEQLLAEDTIQPVKNETEEPSLAEAPSDNSEENAGKEEIKNIIGKMKIECIDLEVPVVEGTDKAALRSAVGHMSGTGLPGSGNCVIAGHRNYSFGRFFNRLDEVQIEDVIKIETTEGETYTYQVRDISVVEPDDVSILEPTGDNILTLITCTPIYIASHRLIVEAELVE